MSAVADPFAEFPRESGDPEDSVAAQSLQRFLDGGSTALVFRPVGESVRWYALARTTRQMRLLGEELAAFLGPTYSTFDGRPAAFDASDPIESPLIEAGLCGFAFDVPASGRQVAIRQIELMLAVMQRQPALVARTPRTVDALLRQFEIALQAGDVGGSEEYLGELGELGAHNVAFLRIHRLAALERWVELLALEELATVLEMRRPRRVTQDIVRAIYNVHIAALESSEAPEAAIEKYRGEVADRYASALTSWGDMHAPEALKLFMLAAVDRADPHLRDAVLAAAERSGRDTQFLKALAAIVEPRRPLARGPEEDTRIALEEHRYEAAFAAAEMLPKSQFRAAALIRCAVELRTLRAASEALATFADLSTDDRLTLSASRAIQMQIDDIRALLSVPEAMTTTDAAESDWPTDWVEWLERVGTGWTGPEALSIARQGSVEWNAQELVGDPVRLAQLHVEFQLSRPPDEAQMIRNAAPFMLSAFGGVRAGEMRGIYMDLATIVALGDVVGPNDLAVIQGLLMRSLAAGVSEDDYERIVQDLTELWNDHGNIYTLPWLLDCIEGLIDYSSPSQDGATRLLRTALEWLADPVHGTRVPSDVWDALESLAEELHERSQAEAIRRSIRVPESPAVGSSRDNPLSGELVGIYTLTERAARGAKDLLEGRFPGVTVKTNSDRVATTDLENLARSANLLVIAWQSAKHAATDAISRVRSRDLPTIYAAGTGRASIVRAVEETIGG